jgi:hypothetical protein
MQKNGREEVRGDVSNAPFPYFRELVQQAILASEKRQDEHRAKIKAEAEAQRLTSLGGARLLDSLVRPILEEAKLAFEEAKVLCVIQDNFSAGKLPPIPQITFQCVEQQEGNPAGLSLPAAGCKAHFIAGGEILRIGSSRSYSNHPENVTISKSDAHYDVTRAVEAALQSYIAALERRQFYLNWSEATDFER